MSQSGARLCLEVTVITLLLITCLLSPWEASAEGGEQGGEFSPTLLRTKGVTLCRRAAVTWALGLQHTVCNLWWEWSQSLYLYWEKKYIVAPENSFRSVNILAQAIFDVEMKCPKCKWFQCWGLFFLSYFKLLQTLSFLADSGRHFTQDQGCHDICDVHDDRDVKKFNTDIVLIINNTIILSE